jgi:hypothetical protein
MMTRDDDPKKVEADDGETKPIKLAKETLRDLAGPDDASRRVKGGKRVLGPSEPSCDATCE